MKRILITGVSGFLGTHLAMGLRKYYRVIGLYNRHKPSIDGIQTYECDITKQQNLGRILLALRPDVVIHAAAVKDITFAETHPRYVETVNVASLANLFPKQHLRYLFIHISTCDVFGGNTGQFHTETEDPIALSHYAGTKRRSEELVMTGCAQWSILRLGHLFGVPSVHKGGMTEGWNATFLKGQKKTFIADRFFTPLLVDEVAPIIRIMIENENTSGIYHIASPDRLSPYSMALAYAKFMGFSTDLIVPHTMEHMPSEKKLGKDVSLSSEKLVKELGYRTLGFEAGLERVRFQKDQGVYIEKELETVDLVSKAVT